MELLNPENDEVVEREPIVEEREPVITRPAASRTLNEEEVVTQRAVPPFLRIVLGVVAIIILAFLIILFARWVYHKAHHSVQPASGNTKQLPTQPSGSSSQNLQGSQATNTPPSSSSSGTTSQNSNIPNSGPGQTAAIFAGASLAAGGIHYIISTRRTNKST
jgi:cytoskeletal protein RodZ